MCELKLKTWKRDQLVSVALLRNRTKFLEKDFVCYKYNHTLEYIETIKVNAKVKNILATEIAKGY